MVPILLEDVSHTGKVDYTISSILVADVRKVKIAMSVAQAVQNL
jgi:hypothetical protein